MLKKLNWFHLGIIALTVVFLLTAVTFEILELASLPAQFFGTLLGVVITAIITVFLLQGQTKSEEHREINLLVFEKKQQVYFDFLTKLNLILQKENLAPHLSEQKKIDDEVVNLQDLIFEFGYLQMHTSSESFNHILTYVAELIEQSNVLKTIDKNQVDYYKDYYKVLSDKYFVIVALLKTELYQQPTEQINKQKIQDIVDKVL